MSEAEEKEKEKENGGRLDSVNEFFQNVERYGSLHDCYFHFCHKDLAIARECVARWLPWAREKLDLANLQVHSWEFYSKTLNKSAVDLIYTVPFRDGSGTIPLPLILEHKAQSSTLDNAATLAQTLGYVASYCQEQVSRRRSGARATPLLQPLPILIYTGADVGLERLNWSDSFYLPEDLAGSRIQFPLRFLNMTRLCQSHQLEASPFLFTAYNLMASASLGILEQVKTTALSPLQVVTDWGPRENELLYASAYYYIKSAVNAHLRVDQTTVTTLFAAIKRRENNTMKSIWAEIGEEIAKNERAIGQEEGRLKNMKENAASMRERGWDDKTIAEILKVDPADVKIWLDSDTEEK